MRYLPLLDEISLLNVCDTVQRYLLLWVLISSLHCQFLAWHTQVLPVDKVFNNIHRLQAYMEIKCPGGKINGRETHEEINATAMLSVVASLTPWSDHNQSPRNMYQCQVLIFFSILNFDAHHIHHLWLCVAWFGNPIHRQT